MDGKDGMDLQLRTILYQPIVYKLCGVLWPRLLKAMMGMMGMMDMMGPRSPVVRRVAPHEV